MWLFVSLILLSLALSLYVLMKPYLFSLQWDSDVVVLDHQVFLTSNELQLGIPIYLRQDYHWLQTRMVYQDLSWNLVPHDISTTLTPKPTLSEGQLSVKVPPLWQQLTSTQSRWGYAELNTIWWDRFSQQSLPVGHKPLGQTHQQEYTWVLQNNARHLYAYHNGETEEDNLPSWHLSETQSLSQELVFETYGVFGVWAQTEDNPEEHTYTYVYDKQLKDTPGRLRQRPVTELWNTLLSQTRRVVYETNTRRLLLHEEDLEDSNSIQSTLLWSEDVVKSQAPSWGQRWAVEDQGQIYYLAVTLEAQTLELWSLTPNTDKRPYLVRKIAGPVSQAHFLSETCLLWLDIWGDLYLGSLRPSQERLLVHRNLQQFRTVAGTELWLTERGHTESKKLDLLNLPLYSSNMQLQTYFHNEK